MSEDYATRLQRLAIKNYHGSLDVKCVRCIEKMNVFSLFYDWKLSLGDYPFVEVPVEIAELLSMDDEELRNVLAFRLAAGYSSLDEATRKEIES